MTTKAKGTSIRQKILDLGKKLGVEPRDLETVFMIERLVARLTANKKLEKNLVFKGGFVGLKIYESPRYTIDLDALLKKYNIDVTLELIKQQAELDLNDGVWFRFESQTDLATQGEYGGIRQSYRSGIGEVLNNVKKAQVIHFDLGIGDPITPGPIKKHTPSIILENEEISWSVYPIETVCAEKLHALISHGNENSRSKDVHDLAIFLTKVEVHILKEAIRRSFEFRSTELPTSFYSEIKKLNTNRLERGWASAVDSIPNAMSFKATFEKMLKLIGEIERAA
jgi:predicted nucleotidyltransferase component of viral defense system